MPENYAEASIRHYKDAELLAKENSFDGAGHLIGFSAECAIKHKIETLRPNQDAPHGHFPDIIETAKRHLIGRRDSRMFQALKIHNLMEDWRVSDRYSPNESTTPDTYKKWRNHASQIIFAAGLKR